MFLFAFMVGAAHYGLAVGRRLLDGKAIHCLRVLNDWPKYLLSKPAHITAYHKGTCLICLFLFLLDGNLRKLPAFNKNGNAWGHTNGGPGYIYITFLAGELLVHISSPHQLQDDARLEFVAQEFRRLGVRVVFADVDQVSRIPLRLEDGRNEAVDEDGEAEDVQLPQNANWWG
jgi:hypothetical protein